VNGLALCAGIGGLELGLRRVFPNLRTVCWVEWDRYAAGILVQRMREGALDAAPVWDDLTTFDGGAWRGRVDLVSAGYPCQPFSCAGKRRGSKDERHLWPEVARTIREVGPEWVVLENVRGHVRLGLDRVLGELADLGFDAEWGCFTAAEVGAPHRRERVFVLAHSRCVGDAGRGEPRDVACAQGDAPTEAQQREWVRDSSGDGGADVEHTEGCWSRRGRGRTGWEERRCRSRRSSGPPLHVAARGLPEREGSHDTGVGVSGFPAAYPPGPCDRDAWERVIAEDPGLAPATLSNFRGVALRSAARLDATVRRHRLRCLGNAVVPAQAERAIRELLGRFEEDEWMP
jgi:DNA (cytosine-5)-methyltransferase 1